MRPILITTLVIASTRLTAAQNAPAPAPPAPPAPPATEPAPPSTEPAPPPEASGPVTMPEHPTESPPALAKSDDKPAVRATYDGGVKLESEDGNYELKLMFRNQIRFESTRPLDNTTTVPGASGTGKQFYNHIYIPRSRLQAEGYVFGKDNRYKLELGLGDAGSFSFVKDLFIDRKIADGPVYLRFGQWKRPFQRAEMVSDFASTFNERSIQNELAGGGRDLGIAVHNDYEKSPEGLEWALGIFNGFSGGSERPAQSSTCQTSATGAVTCTVSRPSNFPTDFGPTAVARVGFNSAKLKGYSEGDLEGGPMRYGVGLSYKVDLANFTDGAKSSWAHNMQHGLELDAMIKIEGFAVDAGVVMMSIRNPDPMKQAHETLYGVFAQPGLFVVPKHGEVAARFAYITGDAADPDRGEIEGRGAFSWFFQGHTYKIASDLGFLMRTGEDAMGNTDKPDLQARVMMQLSI
jgi:hypothetical protein